MTFQEFVKKHNVQMVVTPITGKLFDNWLTDAKHYTCTLFISHPYTADSKQNRESFEYHMGSGIKHGPRTDELLQCLALDSGALNYDCFEDWADDFGYDTDSRKAEHTHKECLAISKRLKTLLGTDRFNELVECEEE